MMISFPFCLTARIMPLNLILYLKSYTLKTFCVYTGPVAIPPAIPPAKPPTFVATTKGAAVQ